MDVTVSSTLSEHGPAELAGAAPDSIARLFDMTSDLLATISADGRFALLNKAWERLLGWTREELQAEPISAFLHPDDVTQVLAPMLVGTARTPAAAGGPASVEIPGTGAGANAHGIEEFTTRFRHRDGSWRWLLWSARFDDGTWFAAARDVSDRKWLERQALHDPLTKLPNRLLLMDRARQALARVHRSEGVVAMLFVDLDKFKAVNDNLGHDTGDRLLVGIAERLSELMRDSDTVARLGGDEFVILAEDVEGENEAISLGARVLDALEDPIPVGNSEVSMLASVGVSVSRDAETDPETLLREADLAMYRAKHGGGRRLELFDEQLRRQVSSNVAIQSRLHEALPRQELALAYQPIMPLDGGVPVGVEALLRWRPNGTGPSGTGELLPPLFLPAAEESELIVQIGDWVLRTACAQAEAWRRTGIAIPVSINISARELTELDLAERIHRQLVQHRLPGHALCVEVSEEAVMRDPERARSALAEVKRLGVSVALDRFGSGRHSLGLPGGLPLDALKLDPGLVAHFHRDKERRALFAAAIALAKESRLTAVAVGIETSRQLALARELDCAVGQGFLLQGPTGPDRVRLRDTGGSGPVSSAPWRPKVRLGGTRGR
jgi:diguanylate cyclase (GGDEF)-like protein